MQAPRSATLRLHCAETDTVAMLKTAIHRLMVIRAADVPLEERDQVLFVYAVRGSKKAADVGRKLGDGEVLRKLVPKSLGLGGRQDVSNCDLELLLVDVRYLLPGQKVRLKEADEKGEACYRRMS